MNRPLLDLSKKIDSSITEILRTIAGVAHDLAIPFFVIGATARDIVFECGYGIKPSRATRDIDLGVKVADWQQFQKLSEGLINTDKFRPSSSRQRFFHQCGTPLDIVPFGPISGNSTSIAWPPDQETEMTVAGFEESNAQALTVRLSNSPLLEIPFASPAGWSLLKIFSWNARVGPDRIKDAQDLSLILRHYAEAGNESRLYEEEGPLLQEENYDLERAGARLLGRDIAALAQPESLQKIITILAGQTGEQERYLLAEEAVENRTFFADQFTHNLALLEKLKQGMAENG
jgi:predicted nucleotidyltransferase